MIDRKDRWAMIALVGAVTLSAAITVGTAAQIVLPVVDPERTTIEEPEDDGFAILKELQEMILVDEVRFAMQHVTESVQDTSVADPVAIAEEPAEAETIAEETAIDGPAETLIAGEPVIEESAETIVEEPAMEETVEAVAVEEPAAEEPEVPEWYSEAVPLSYYLQGVLFEACEYHGVPYGLALGVIETESNFQHDVVSSTGDYGLMQISDRYFHSRWFTPEENIWKGVEILRSKYEQYWNWPSALTAYNAGYDTGSRWYSNRVYENGAHWGFWMG